MPPPPRTDCLSPVLRRLLTSFVDHFCSHNCYHCLRSSSLLHSRYAISHGASGLGMWLTQHIVRTQFRSEVHGPSRLSPLTSHFPPSTLISHPSPPTPRFPPSTSRLSLHLPTLSPPGGHTSPFRDRRPRPRHQVQLHHRPQARANPTQGQL